MTGGPIAAFHRANLLTYVSLAAAMGAIAMAGRGNLAGAGSLIALAVIADTFDGKFARQFHRTEAQRRFGVELDSLSDAVAFGAAPAACMMHIASVAPGIASLAAWAAAAVFAACAITRLAFFNITHADSAGFVGLPSPVAALLWATALLFDPGATASAIVLFAAALAMVAPIGIPRPSGAGLALFAAWPSGVIVAFCLL